jgi:hypothetical protein
MYYLRWILTAELLLALRLTLYRNIKGDCYVTLKCGKTLRTYGCKTA